MVTSIVLSIPRVTATIDLAAVRHNLARVRAFAPQSRVMAAVKADGYGHGAVRIARTLVDAGVDSLAVACLEEAVVLRNAGIAAPIALLEGVLSVEEAREAARLHLQIVVHDPQQLALLESLQDATLALWFKIDTGMHRLGFAPTAVPVLAQALRQRPAWTLCGWMTHLACADETENRMTARQIALFDEALFGQPGLRSIANSAGIIAWPDARRDWVRPGLMLYGASPMPGRAGRDLDLKPAMRLESRLLSIHDVPAGETIGYGATYRCDRLLRIGVVAAGYADGVLRSLPSGTPTMIHGVCAPMVGRVSMDMITVDLAAVPQAQVGDRVMLWGDGLPAEEIAQCAGTLAYELFCGLTRRVQFVYTDSSVAAAH
jgi:alanine racemase